MQQGDATHGIVGLCLLSAFMSLCLSVSVSLLSALCFWSCALFVIPGPVLQTMLAKALATESGLNFIAVKGQPRIACRHGRVGS